MCKEMTGTNRPVGLFHEDNDGQAPFQQSVEGCAATSVHILYKECLERSSLCLLQGVMPQPPA